MSIERVIMNKETGELAVGIRLKLIDQSLFYFGPRQHGAFICSNEPDAWAVSCEEHYIVVFSMEAIKQIKDLGPL